MAVAKYPTYPVTFTENDELPEIPMTLKCTDLTGFTVTLHIARPDGSVLIKTATPVDLVQGAVKFVFVAGDLQAGFGQLAEIQYVNASAKAQTSPKFLINVEKEIA